MKWWIGTFALTTMLAVGCSKDDKNDDDTTSTNTSEGYWAIGDDSEMLRITDQGEVDSHQLPGHEDLYAIACKGAATAWAVGETGTLISTTDAGQTWEYVSAGTDAALRAVANAEDTEHVFVVGDDGAFVVSDDDGVSWTSIATPALDWTGVATDAKGIVAMLTASDGSIWRYTDGGGVESVFAAEGERLHAVSMTPNGSAGVAVGEDGFMVETRDAGHTWRQIALPTVRDLLAVRMSHDGVTTVAVGESGVMVRIDDGGVVVDELLDPSLSLRALHLRAHGDGQAVGEAGVVLVTEDGGSTWSSVEVGTTVRLNGVDDFHAGPHL